MLSLTGHTELAVALCQAEIEFNFCSPSVLHGARHEGIYHWNYTFILVFVHYQYTGNISSRFFEKFRADA